MNLGAPLSPALSPLCGARESATCKPLLRRVDDAHGEEVTLRCEEHGLVGHWFFGHGRMRYGARGCGDEVSLAWAQHLQAQGPIDFQI